MAMDIMTSPNNELMSALSTLLEAGKYSDLTIKCRERKFAVHRALVCSRSGFFDGACSSAFREAESGVIDLSEDDEEAVEHMVNYFYHLDYLSPPKSMPRSTRSSRSSSTVSNPMSTVSQFSLRPHSPAFGRKKLNLAFVEDPLLATAAATLMTPISPAQPILEEPRSAQTSAHPTFSLSASHTRVSSITSALMTPPVDADNPFEDVLKFPPPADSAVGDLESDRLEDVIEEQEANSEHPYLMTHCKVYAIAEKYSIAGLKHLARAKFASQAAVHFDSEEFADAIQDVYDTTVDEDRGLRDVVIQAFREHPELALRKDVEAVVKETPGLAWELFRVGWGLPVH